MAKSDIYKQGRDDQCEGKYTIVNCILFYPIVCVSFHTIRNQ